MITKQETFKRLLSGHYRSVNSLDKKLWTMMKEKFYWSLTATDLGEDIAFKSVTDFKSVPGDFYVKSIYQDSLEWHKNIKACLVKLGRI